MPPLAGLMIKETYLEIVKNPDAWFPFRDRDGGSINKSLFWMKQVMSPPF